MDLISCLFNRNLLFSFLDCLKHRRWWLIFTLLLLWVFTFLRGPSFLLSWLIRESWTGRDNLAQGRSFATTSSSSSRRWRGSYSRYCPIVYNSPEKKVYIAEGDPTLNPAIPFRKPLESYQSGKDKRGRNTQSLFHPADPFTHSASLSLTPGLIHLIHVPLLFFSLWKLSPGCSCFLLSLVSRDVGGSFDPLWECCRGPGPPYTAWQLLWHQTDACPGLRDVARPGLGG